MDKQLLIEAFSVKVTFLFSGQLETRVLISLNYPTQGAKMICTLHFGLLTLRDSTFSTTF